MAKEIGRVLALDVGKKRIGLAMSDPLRIIPQGLPTLHRTRVRDDLDFLANLIEREGVILVLIGEPLHMSGDSSRQGEYTHEFADKLAKRTQVRIEFRDERLTSVEAERFLKESGVTTDRRSGNVDRIAAVLLLENYLESLPSEADQDD